MVTAIGCLVAGAGAAGWATGAIQAPVTTSAAAVVPSVTGDPRADALLARMSLTDKLRLLEWAAGTGQQDTAVLPGVGRLGIPRLHLTGGPLGSVTQPAPAMAAPLAVAATFSRADAYANGMVLGRDARALGQQAVARPFVALATSPGGGPAGASFGEDPLLAGQTAAAEIAGIQAQGTMALVSGSLSGGPSGGAGTGPAVDPAALQEIYLQPVQDAVRAGAAGLICSPGTLTVATGTGAQPGRPPRSPACGDAALLTQTLRQELGFGGFVIAGQGANPGTVSLDSGLDGEITGTGRAAGYFTPAAIRAAVASGTVGQATIDQAAGAILAEMDRFGLLGRSPKHRAAREPVGADEQIVTRTAQDAATLLKNAGHVLPLTATELGSLALIGPGAAQVAGADPAGGNGPGIPGRRPGTLQVLRQELAIGGGAHLTYAAGDDLTGSPVPASALSHDGQPGLVRASTGTAATQVVTDVNNTLTRGDALPARSAHTWTGELTAPVTGSYRIGLATSGARGTIGLDGTTVAQDRAGQPPGPADALVPTTDGLGNLRASVSLTAGTHTLSVSEVPDGSGRPVQVRLDWVTPAQQQANVAAAVAAARGAKAAVVFALGTGATAGTGSGAGGWATLPDGQDQLISDVAAVNPDTIVVLNTPGPVSMPWLSQVKGVLEMWYPGDGGGFATANVLLGRADPAGRLPVTWPVAGRAAQAQAGGVFVGYRWYDRNGRAPLFPFGYGLSYTRFSYSGLSWRTAPGRGLLVRFRVTDSGQRAGDAVPQVYLGAPARRPAGAVFAPESLAAFTRVGLRPGQTRAVTLQVPLRQLQYWDSTRGWVTATGRRPLEVGPDERSSALSTTVTIR
jgi:beta-glucosidase